MRHIPMNEQLPNQVWIDKAKALLDQLNTAPDAEARNAIIDANKRLWGELKEWLLELSHDKCWFSEAKDCFSHWDVEHYRPKKTAKDADGTTHEGYWWLAFDWTNLRICGNAGNRKKGTYFPLVKGGNRASGPNDDLRHEDPQLLDPVDKDDPNLLSFNMEGEAIPAADITDDWEKSRVEYSVTRYKLDFPPLVNKRKTVWNECWERLQAYKSELSLYQKNKTNLIAKEKFRDAAKSVRQMMQADKELSAVARACVISTGDQRLMGLLQSN